MEHLVLLLVGLTAAFAAQTGITCPKCSNEYDYMSCTQTQTCHNSQEVCELQVHLADNNRLAYKCVNSHACVNHEGHACDVNQHEMCAYCCTSLDACKKQREEVFAMFATQPPAAATTTMAVNATMMPAMTTMPSMTNMTTMMTNMTNSTI